MALSDSKLKALKPKLRAYKVADGASLYVVVTPSGGRLWRFDYQHAGKRKTLSLGRWPAVSLKAARDRRNDAQAMLGDGVDPCDAKQARKHAAKPSEKPTFEQAGREWHAAQLRRWSEDYGPQVLTRLEADVFPHIGAKRFADITRGDILETLRKVEARGVHETARRLRQYVGAIYRYAGATDESVVDPSPMLRGAMEAPPAPVHHNALKPRELGEFMVKLKRYDKDHGGDAETRLALQLTIFTVGRTGEIINAEWSEFEHIEHAEKALWRIPGERMKAGDPHLVPLSKQAREALIELHEITGGGKYLFPIARGTPGRRKVMSNNSMLFALYRLGYRGRATVHGFRRNFSTWANEGGWPSDDVELCLAHDERDRVRGAYNAAQRLEPRRKLLQAWASYLQREANIFRTMTPRE
ncbi:MAG: integrase arm-type DNA-binding domain-containing protein [Caulobacterales bacterium]|nr:integrase arm-type DNA-binding domain-containing protein [Caulobacterales bacterium]